MNLYPNRTLESLMSSEGPKHVSFISVKVVRFYFLGLVTLFLLGLLLVAYRGQLATDRIESITKTQADVVTELTHNTTVLQAALIEQCDNQNINAKSTNDLIKSLRAFVNVTSGLPPDVIIQRQAIAANLKVVPFIKCKS